MREKKGINDYIKAAESHTRGLFLSHAKAGTENLATSMSTTPHRALPTRFCTVSRLFYNRACGLKWFSRRGALSIKGTVLVWMEVNSEFERVSFMLAFKNQCLQNQSHSFCKPCSFSTAAGSVSGCQKSIFSATSGKRPPAGLQIFPKNAQDAKRGGEHLITILFWCDI